MRRSTPGIVLEALLLAALQAAGCSSQADYEKEAATAASVAPLAFPGAEGFGKNTRGAYGGSGAPAILIVDSLADGSTGSDATGRGTLRWAVTRSYPRIVLFEVSGVIDMSANIMISQPYLSIYGQSAPAPGVILKKGTLEIRAHDVVAQNLKFRIGDESGGADESIRDGFRIMGGYNIIVDHCDMLWAVDECLDIHSGAHDITISNSLIGEGVDADQYNNYGMLVYGNTYNLTLVKTIIANVSKRFPLANDAQIEIINRLFYNPKWEAIDLGCGTTASIIGSETKPGPESSEYSSYLARARSTDGCATASRQRIYVRDNVYVSSSSTGISNGNSYDVMIGEPPFSSGAQALAGGAAEGYALDNAGAFAWDRDVTSGRIMAAIRNSNARYIGSQRRVEGYGWITPSRRDILAQPGYPARDPHGDDDFDGYTNIEEWAFSQAK
jgi:pectate lyase